VYVFNDVAQLGGQPDALALGFYVASVVAPLRSAWYVERLLSNSAMAAQGRLQPLVNV
jgi:hypothetical protein